MDPVWLTVAVASVMRLKLLELLFFSVKLPVPVMPELVEKAEAPWPDWLSSRAIVAFPVSVIAPVVSCAVPLATLLPPCTVNW